jgi:predicted RNase H-like HicB family nuclease
MREICFIVKEAEEGGYVARAIGQSIFTEADSVEQLKLNIKDVLECHFENKHERPQIANLHFVKDEVLTFA